VEKPDCRTKIAVVRWFKLKLQGFCRNCGDLSEPLR
jgi:hypothetical protein